MPPHHLPSQATPFVGRNEELRAIDALLSGPTCRLVSLIGPGGIGKTRLALEITRRQRERFHSGAHFVSLQPVASVEQIVPAITSAIGLQLHQQDALQQLADHLHTQHCLLVLDNFEHLLEGADILSRLIAATSHVAIVVTSRERLNLLEEWIFDVGGLEVPPEGEQPSETGYSAVELFVTSAQRNRRDFAPATEREAVFRICRLVEGMPLALELAATRTTALPVAEIARQLENGLDILTSQTRNMPARHRRMRYVLDESWVRLSQPEQSAVRQLSVFRGGFTREAALSVAGASIAVLGSLTSKTWLRFDPQQDRYDLHELLRQFGAERLSETPGEWQAAHNHHAAYYAERASQLEKSLHGQQLEASLAGIEAEFANLRQAWQWSLQQRRVDLLDAMIECLWRYCDIRLYVEAAVQLFDTALAQVAALSGDEPRRVWARLLARRVQFSLLEQYPTKTPNDYRRLKALIEQALAIARQFQDADEIGFCLWRLAMFTGFELEENVRALALANECLLYARDSGNTYLTALSLKDIAYFSLCAGNIEAARPPAQESLQLLEQSGDERETGSALVRLAAVENAEGHYEAASALYLQARKLLRRIGEVHYSAHAAFHLGTMAFRNGDFSATKCYGEEVLHAGRQYRLIQAIGEGLALLGLAASIEGDSATAVEKCREAVPMLSALPLNQFYAHLGLAIATAHTSDISDTSGITAATTIATETRHIPLALQCLPVIALHVAQAGFVEQAVMLLAAVYTHPMRTTGWMDGWPLLRQRHTEWRAALGSSGYDAAWERGATLDVLAVVRDFALGRSKIAHQPEAQATVIRVRPVDQLTQREQQVLSLIASGLSNRAIARQLHVSLGTVKWYNNQLFSKLDASSRTHAVARAHELNLLD